MSIRLIATLRSERWMLPAGEPQHPRMPGSESPRDRGLDPSVVDSPKVILLEGTVSQPKLGLTDDLYEELRTSVTHVIHISRFHDHQCVYVSLRASKAGESISIRDLPPSRMISRVSVTSSI